MWRQGSSGTPSWREGGRERGKCGSAPEGGCGAGLYGGLTANMLLPSCPPFRPTHAGGWLPSPTKLSHSSPRCTTSSTLPMPSRYAASSRGGGGKRGRKMTAIFHITYAIQMRRCLIHQRHVEGMHGGGGLLGRYMATISFPPSSPISVLSQRMAPFFVAECIACSHTACVHTAFIHTISPHTSSPAQSAPKNTHVPPPPSHLSSSLCTAYPAPFPCIPPSAEHAPPPPCFAPAHRMMMRRGRPGWRSWRGCL